MLVERLQERCSSASVQGVASLADWRMSFSKRSRYGSGKATIAPAIGHKVFGVVFDVSHGQLSDLDRAEGPGYSRQQVDVRLEDSGETVSAITYVATPEHTDDTLEPCDWYVSLIVAGARQHELPLSYVQEISATAVIVDPIPERSGGREALELLKRHRFDL